MNNLATLIESADDVIAIDFEYRSQNMQPPEVRCLCALSLKTGQRWEIWFDQSGEAYPFDENADIVFVCHFAEAELGCFLALGWPMPKYVLDSCVMVKQLRALPVKKVRGIKKMPPPFNKGTSLLATLEACGISHGYEDTKGEMRDLALLDKRNHEYSPEERQALLAYCWADVVVYEKLLPALCAHFDDRKHNILNQLPYTGTLIAFAEMTQRGVPLDEEQWRRFCERWPQVKDQFIYENDTLGLLSPSGEISREALTNFLIEHDYTWPARPTSDGGLDISDKTLERASELIPELDPIRQVKKLVKALQSATTNPDKGLQVGDDFRTRNFFAPFSTITSRNAPSSFILSASKALRHLITPREGYALASLDWKSQEFIIAGALSGDEGMIHDYYSGDVYISFAKRVSMVPENANADSHPNERQTAKALVLGIGYGMSEVGLGSRLKIATFDAAEYIAKYWGAYSTYKEWSDQLPDVMIARGYLETQDNWRLFPVLDNNIRTVRNFIMQGTGACILREAIRLCRAHKIEMLATNHDSIMIQAPADQIEEAVELTTRLMIEASQKYLNGHKCLVDLEQMIVHPENYNPKAGRDLFQQLKELCK